MKEILKILFGIGSFLVSIWIPSWIGGCVLPDDWNNQWYGFPMAISLLAFFGIFMVIGVTIFIDLLSFDDDNYP